MVDKPELISTDLPPGYNTRSYDDEPRMVNIERTRPGLNDGHGGGSVLSNKYNMGPPRDDQRPYTSAGLTNAGIPSISLHVQNSLRKYQMERKIFEELLELKRNQIRAGRANEQLLVKRLSDSYAKTINELAGLKNYDGPFTFKEFEKYLYSQLRSSQYGRRPRSMPGLLPSSG